MSSAAPARPRCAARTRLPSVSRSAPNVPQRVSRTEGSDPSVRTPGGPPLEAEWVARLEAARGAQHGAPAGTAQPVAVARRAGVQAQAGDHGEGVARVGVHREPAALAGESPAHEAAGVQ